MDELVSRILLEYKSTQFTQPLFSEVVLIHSYRYVYMCMKIAITYRCLLLMLFINNLKLVDYKNCFSLLTELLGKRVNYILVV